MFPKTFIDKTECLESLVGIRTGCSVDEQHPFWIEDLEGVDIKKLSSMAKASNPSGKDFARQLINNASRQMIGDVELLLNNGYRLNNIVNDMCSTCSLIPTYVVNTGIVIKSVVASKYMTMKITKLTVLANVTGTRQIVIDDSDTPQYFSVDLVAGVLMPITLNYTTTKKSVKVQFTDVTVPLGQIVCSSNSGCGCGGSPTSNMPVHIKGLVAGVESSTQYGFLPCVGVTCSYESLVCSLIKQAPNIFGLTLLYKVGELYFDNKRVADRNNDAVAFNEESPPTNEFKKNYQHLYWAKLKRTKDTFGINKIINDFLRTNRTDKCVLCDAKILTAYVTG